MRICDNGCQRKKICRLYEMALNLRGEIQFEVTQCVHFSSSGQMSTPVVPLRPQRDINEINETSAKIHALQQNKEKNVSTTTVAKAKNNRMQFSVDDQDIN